MWCTHISILQALTNTTHRYHIWGEMPHPAPAILNSDKRRDPEPYHSLLERHYTAVSLKHHIEATEFVRNYKTLGIGEHRDLIEPHYLKEVPHLGEMLGSLTVDPGSFHAYFSSQLSENERILLSAGADREKVPASNSSKQHGLPTPAQLKEVAAVLGDSVSWLFGHESLTLVFKRLKFKILLLFSVTQIVYATHEL